MQQFMDGKVSDRKARLYRCACCRHIWSFITDKRCRMAVEVAERYVDRMVTAGELEQAYSEALAMARANDGRCDVDYTCAAAAETGLGLSFLYVAEGAANHSDGMLEPYCDYVRDIVGNPFRPVSIVPSWLSWCRDIIPRLMGRTWWR